MNLMQHHQIINGVNVILPTVYILYIMVFGELIKNFNKTHLFLHQTQMTTRSNIKFV